MKLYLISTLFFIFTLLGFGQSAILENGKKSNPRETIGKSRVIGGSEATRGQFPFIVSLQFLSWFGGSHPFCAGVIYNEKFVITNAHCMIYLAVDNLTVVAGVHDIFYGSNETEPNKQVVKVAKYILHPQYDDSQFDNDAAVIELQEPLIFNNFVQPIKLVDSHFDPSDVSCTNIGWGNANNGSGHGTFPPLQHAQLPIVKRSTCKDLYPSYLISDSMVCAGGGGSGSCSGDSGGPLICKNQDGEDRLAATVSWGMIPCALENQPTVFANVGYMTDFYMSVINAH